MKDRIDEREGFPSSAERLVHCEDEGMRFSGLLGSDMDERASGMRFEIGDDGVEPWRFLAIGAIENGGGQSGDHLTLVARPRNETMIGRRPRQAPG